MADAGIFYRPSARQVLISTGNVDTSDPETPSLDRSVQWVPGEHGLKDPTRSRGTRKKITEFTARSRRRLRRWIHAIPRNAECLFLTLTYHETEPRPREAKEDLDAFCKSLRRAYPSCSIVWKMEPQARGTVHFHLLVYGVQYVPAVRVSERWHDCTNETSEAHRRAGVDIERAVHQEDGKLQSYLSKYMGKEIEAADLPEAWDEPGRWWGIRGRADLPLGRWDPAWYMDAHEAERLIYALLDEWGVDLPEYTDIPCLTICTRGDPEQALSQLP
jgi:hypothetical protein